MQIWGQGNGLIGDKQDHRSSDPYHPHKTGVASTSMLISVFGKEQGQGGDKRITLGLVATRPAPGSVRNPVPRIRQRVILSNTLLGALTLG